MRRIWVDAAGAVVAAVILTVVGLVIAAAATGTL